MWLRIAIISMASLAFLASDLARADEAAPIRLPVRLGATDLPHDSVVVEPGDHLWRISKRHLDLLDEGSPAVAPYWREVIELNLPHLRSGNADLIYPGEVIDLPGVSDLR